MKIKSLLLFCCFVALSTSSLAQNRHIHPGEKAAASQTAATKAMAPGFCEIEIINDSYDNLTVYGEFDDRTLLVPFNIYRYDTPHYIDLYYYGYCHSSMMLTITTFGGYRVYSGYAPVEHTIRIVPSMNNQVKAITVEK